MKPRPRIQLWLTISALVFAGLYSVWALDPSKPPGQNFDLSHWKLTLPVDKNGTTNGNAVDINSWQLVSGYTNALYFYTGPDGAMVFWCPVTGATTSGSSYPRSELREMLNTNDDNVNWTGYGTHILDSQCKVLKVPSSGKTIIGQIHSFLGNAYPLIKLQYNSGTVEALVKESSSSDTDTHFSFANGNVGLSNSITYEIKVVDGLLTLAVNGSTQSVNFFLTDTNWSTNTFYFKAGDYCQDNVGTTNEGALVSFYSVTASHPVGSAPAITAQPTNQTVAVGQTASFNVTAAGTAPLSYRWRFNVTNSVPSATNAALTLNNVQSTNAGGYTVVVTNAYGSVTSTVATLTVSNQPPNINTQPVDQVVFAGQTAVFSVAATGSTPLTYQWLFNNTNSLSNGTNATLNLSNAQSNNAGGYTVLVSNSADSVTSVVALLTVLPAVVGTSSFQWDAATNLAGIQDGPGIWQANTVSNSFWSTNGGLSNQPWPASNTVAEAVFGGGSSGTAGVITMLSPLASAPTVDALTFNLPFAGDYTLVNSAGGAGPVLADGATITVNGGNPAINSPLGGSSATAGFTKLGPGPLWLGDANTFSGIVTIAEGALVIGADTALGANPAALVTNQLTLDGGLLRVTNSLTWGTKRGILLTTNGGTIEVAAGLTLTMSGSSSAPESIAGAPGGSLVKTGGGTFSIQLVTTNTFPGQTIVNGGTLALLGNNGVVAIPGDLTLNPGTTLSIAASKSGLLGAGISVTNNGGTFIAGGAETLDNLVLGGNGLLTNGSTSSRTFTVANNIILQSGTIEGNGTPPVDRLVLAGSASLFKTTSGTVVIVGTNTTQVANTFTGKSILSAGLLNIGLDTALGANPGSLTPDQLTLDGGTLQITNAFTWGSRRGVTLTANGGGFDIAASQAQTLPVAVAGTAGGALVKLGPGSLSLSAANSYNGDTIVSNGVLVLAAAGAVSNSPFVRLASGASLDVSAAGLSVPSSQTLAGSGTVLGNATLVSGARLQPGAGALKLTISGNLSLANNTLIADLAGASLSAGVYRLVDYSGSKSGSFNAVPIITNGTTAGTATLDQSTNHQVNLVVGSTPVSQPRFSGAVLSAAGLVLSGTGGSASAPYYVLSSTNLGLSLSNWTVISTNSFDSGGGFNFTNPVDPTRPQQFLDIRTQ